MSGMTGPERVARERAGVLCAGTLLVDQGKTIDAYPARDSLAVIEDITTSTGGAGLNMAMDLRRLGAEFEIGVLGCLADDAAGDYILAACAEAGVDTAMVEIRPGATTAFTDVMVERVGGRRTFFWYAGTNADFHAEPDDIAASNARVLHVGNLGAHPRMEQRDERGESGWSVLLAAARAAGMHTNLELTSLAPERLEQLAGHCLPHLDSVIVNELEASALTGAAIAAPDVDEPVDWPAMEGLAVGLIERGVAALAVVHFPAGSVAATAGGHVLRQGSVRVPADMVRSTTGAGDAFAAGVILGLHAGWPLADGLRLGSAAAAACIQDAHTSNGIGPAAACLAAADRYGFRAT
jgi:sugar/nucleoside kinase (ribokinase family)